ncbi:hypothetical protein BD408DRAFT_470854 [Parasitella parasitica]|nr:hypothetical protein BD408DRAFT_470854 [Parasitella parasitica]
MTRISKACDSLYMSDFKGFVLYLILLNVSLNDSIKRSYKVETSVKWPPNPAYFIFLICGYGDYSDVAAAAITIAIVLHILSDIEIF